MESEVRLSQDQPLGGTQYISSFSLLTNIWAEGRKHAQRSSERRYCLEKTAQADSFSSKHCSGESETIWAQANCQPAVRDPMQHMGPSGNLDSA